MAASRYEGFTDADKIRDAPIYKVTDTDMLDFPALLAKISPIANEHGAVRVDPPADYSHGRLRMRSNFCFFVREQNIPEAPFVDLSYFCSDYDPSSPPMKRTRTKSRVIHDDDDDDDDDDEEEDKNGNGINKEQGTDREKGDVKTQPVPKIKNEIDIEKVQHPSDVQPIDVENETKKLCPPPPSLKPTPNPQFRQNASRPNSIPIPISEPVVGSQSAAIFGNASMTPTATLLAAGTPINVIIDRCGQSLKREDQLVQPSG